MCSCPSDSFWCEFVLLWAGGEAPLVFSLLSHQMSELLGLGQTFFALSYELLVKAMLVISASRLLNHARASD